MCDAAIEPDEFSENYSLTQHFCKILKNIE